MLPGLVLFIYLFCVPSSCLNTAAKITAYILKPAVWVNVQGQISFQSFQLAFF